MSPNESRSLCSPNRSFARSSHGTGQNMLEHNLQNKGTHTISQSRSTFLCFASQYNLLQDRAKGQFFCFALRAHQYFCPSFPGASWQVTLSLFLYSASKVLHKSNEKDKKNVKKMINSKSGQETMIVLVQTKKQFFFV